MSLIKPKADVHKGMVHSLVRGPSSWSTIRERDREWEKEGVRDRGRERRIEWERENNFLIIIRYKTDVCKLRVLEFFLWSQSVHKGLGTYDHKFDNPFGAVARL